MLSASRSPKGGEAAMTEVEQSDIASAEDARRRLRFMDREDSTKWTAADRELYVYAHTVEQLFERIESALATSEHDIICGQMNAIRPGNCTCWRAALMEADGTVRPAN